MKTFALSAALAAGLLATAAQGADIRIALVAKSLGNRFFEAAAKGAEEVAKQLGDVRIIYTGPTTTTAEGQIEVINALISQKVDAIAISANDKDAVVPVLKRALQRGIKVISWDSAVAAEGRLLHLNPSSDPLIGAMLAKLAAQALPDGRGKIAILSATPTSTNQNTWIAEMKAALRDHPGIDLVATVYGDDLSDKSYRETQGLLRVHPDVKVIVAPTSVGITAAVQAVKDAGKVGQVYVTGLGLPSEMAGAVHAGVTKSFAIWNPIDLGYATAYLAYDLVKGAKATPAAELPMGRVGTLTVGADGSGAMAEPAVFDSANIDRFADLF
ncbi:rhamnose ABC transporter substrate-binding protein [Methylobacterium brachiatum]|uniref:rhamnose ABC transporter substrate-binding protein n=1 Tax=Methylobacterium brachiatum TaxID=269660 RepID=UPI0024481483|nr:rhamnose ABC transporter substrate-binding protein [Methylobacterium brachiatum]MDH2313602.1 rhamnose ABC transporter substrate-binding protein [Methylobacterium brachiatum]